MPLVTLAHAVEQQLAETECRGGNERRDADQIRVFERTTADHRSRQVQAGRITLDSVSESQPGKRSDKARVATAKPDQGPE